MDELDRWTRVLPLGAGAFGEVHLAWDRDDGRWVALKRFTGQDELGLLRMVVESRIRVSHPHLVRTLSFHLVDDRAWLVTELARGGSLRGLTTRTGALPWGWVVEAVDQVLAALAALHATGVVHRDLKPANLLLRSYGGSRPHLLVGDFGIATWRTVSMTGIGAAIGTPGYLAPEYLDGHQPSPATDLFAVGVLAAELIAGRRLVHYSNASPTMPSSWQDVVPVPAEVPHRVAAVLHRMAAPDPAHRYADSHQAREALLAAAPAGTRGDLTGVPVPDLLAALPPGWTPEGPDKPRTTAAAPHLPNLTALPIDGGPTALVPENEATAPRGGASTPASRGPLQPPAASSAPPHPHTSDESTQPPTPTGSPTAHEPHMTGSPARQPTGPPVPPATPPSGSPTPATTPPSSQPTPPDGAPRNGDTSPAHRRARRHRRLRQATLLLVLTACVAGAGTLWWAADHRTIPGQGSAAGRATDEPGGTTRWLPTTVAPCSRVEVGNERTGESGRERCQRTPDRDPAQHWVEEPPGGFPISDGNGPFPGETCTAEGDRKYSPVGDHVRCEDGTWQVIGS